MQNRVHRRHLIYLKIKKSDPTNIYSSYSLPSQSTNTEIEKNSQCSSQKKSVTHLSQPRTPPPSLQALKPPPPLPSATTRSLFHHDDTAKRTKSPALSLVPSPKPSSPLVASPRFSRSRTREIQFSRPLPGGEGRRRESSRLSRLGETAPRRGREINTWELKKAYVVLSPHRGPRDYPEGGSCRGNRRRRSVRGGGKV
ncbi:hypothetical protein H6P81_017147 [Aristolochia fimbriata]|uniref:Uncharacterized protein n=1 Tax=Aristolochia fimbriata TaxID=158543 RepID=A0AAV7DXJ1_ARIFI|nr:hypothetical protein H6P81_017147 [Aristolochia fimbriata]